MAELLVFSVWKVDRFVPQLPLNTSSQIFGGFRHYISEKSGVAWNDFYNGISHHLRVHSIVVRTKNLIEEILRGISLQKIQVPECQLHGHLRTPGWLDSRLSPFKKCTFIFSFDI